MRVLVGIPNFGTKNRAFLDQMIDEFRAMTHDVPRGAVLILSDSPASGERLRRWADAAGEQPELRLLDQAVDDVLDGVDGHLTDLVVTDLDSDAPSTVQLLRRLLDDD